MLLPKTCMDAAFFKRRSKTSFFACKFRKQHPQIPRLQAVNFADPSHGHHDISLKFNSSPLKSYLPNQERIVFQLVFFRGYVKLCGCRCLLERSPLQLLAAAFCDAPTHRWQFSIEAPCQVQKDLKKTWMTGVTIHCDWAKFTQTLPICF